MRPHNLLLNSPRAKLSTLKLSSAASFTSLWVQPNALWQVEQIMLARKESFSMSSMAALGEVTALKGKITMTKTQAENVLASFVAKGWLLKSK